MPENKLNKKYGLITAVAMVVGIVIGSGVFFKAERILKATEGNLPIAILAWIIGGLIMVVCACAFAKLATRYERMNGAVDYAERIVGPRYGYMIGWFMSTLYYPTMTSVLAWVSARYACVLFGFSITGGECLVIACFFLCGSYAVNALSPILAGKFQVATTVIKLVPLILMAVIGTIVGVSNGTTAANFAAATPGLNTGSALFTAVCATAFAYEGWIIATSINAELKDSKKNLPRALVLGAFLIIAVYILYYIGLAGAVTNEALLESAEGGVRLAFENVFSSVGGVLLFVLVIISCLGTLNGLMLACTRGMYTIAIRNQGPKPAMFKSVDKTTNMPSNSAIVGLLLCAFWLLYFYGANLTASWFGPFSFDTSELPIITIYAFYIPIFIMVMIKEKDMTVFSRYILSGLAVAGSLFMIIAACVSHGMAVVFYLIVFAVIMAIGMLFMKPKADLEVNSPKE